MDARTLVKTLLGFALAALLLGTVTALTGTERVLDAIARAETGVVGLVGIAILAWLCVWGAGLQQVLTAIGAEISYRDAVLVNASAAFANHVTPFGQAGGEPIAAWLLADATGIDYERALAAVASFDTINVGPSLTLAAIGTTYYAAVSTLPGELRLVGVAVAGLWVVLVGSCYVGSQYWTAMRRVIARLVASPAQVIAQAIPRVSAPSVTEIEARLDRFAGDIGRVATDRRRLALATAFSTAGWLVQSIGLWLALYALGVSIPGHVPLFVIPMGTMANVLPTPGGLGGVEAVQVTLLVAATNVPPATVTAAVVIFSVGGFLVTTSVGAAAATVLQFREWQPVRP